jgi:hypothetical protein
VDGWLHAGRWDGWLYTERRDSGEIVAVGVIDDLGNIQEDLPAASFGQLASYGPSDLDVTFLLTWRLNCSTFLLNLELFELCKAAGIPNTLVYWLGHSCLSSAEQTGRLRQCVVADYFLRTIVLETLRHYPVFIIQISFGRCLPAISAPERLCLGNLCPKRMRRAVIP